MPINKETIISVFNEKLTLEQWLKTVNKALDEAVLTGVEIAKKGNATLSFKFTFEDGTFLESNDLVLQQGESVQSAYIQDGHLFLTLTNGTNLDAGNIKPVSNFAINDSQHLIVNYQDGTSQDLGAIFDGNVNISGTLNATKITGNEIVENMQGYSVDVSTTEMSDLNVIYAGACKNGNKLTLVVFASFKKPSATGIKSILRFTIPQAVADKLYPTEIISGYSTLEYKNIDCVKASGAITQAPLSIFKLGGTSNLLDFNLEVNNLDLDTTYFARAEVTFLLSDNLAQ